MKPPLFPATDSDILLHEFANEMALLDVEAFLSSVLLVADDIPKLGQPDVMRVIKDFFQNRGTIQPVVDLISLHRPDLRDEALACQAELTQLSPPP